MRLIEGVWRSESSANSAARAALTPLEVVYRALVAARNGLYDLGFLPAEKSRIPVISIGNVTVGGTGKTPVAAWIAARLRAAGKSPAIVMRGYGDDEPEVHRRINPDVPVIVNPDRVAGIRSAADRGATIAILDDAFQHRRASRSADIVLMSADSWTGRVDLLPAGPFREPLSSLARASLVLITRKAGGDPAVDAVELAIREAAAGVPIASARLTLDEIVDVNNPDDKEPIVSVAGKSVFAIAAVGDPNAFFAQLRSAGASVTERSFADHYAFDKADAVNLAEESRHADYVVCTLKDAVKLAPLWPAASRRLWYVSLAVRIERGSASIEELLARF